MANRITNPACKQRDAALEAAHAFLAAYGDLPASAFATAFDERNRRNKRAHLLGLPGELRNKIYHFALMSNPWIKVVATGPIQPPLLRVCRQTREEALPTTTPTTLSCS
ncbi:hypothetical protein DOTSEDRAFT_23045 [Dothistroma septosporum NZE10]|uniref:Uncharacterized protein n=1 Tax=Dothistroma septosporum (strain NZE10 / CBS 128990) TaxID=675120 RepID=N1PNG5_DOTSN|nr:hypothetical protein DOTSEDRAFT_23045 [Dothistroma septosporum NZE10]